MKISRVRHVVITSIIFLIIIAIMVAVFTSTIDALRKNTEEMVYRVVATQDIEPGKPITSNNVQLVQMQNVLDAEGLIYRMGKNDDNVSSVEEYQNGIRRNNNDDLWAVGKVAKDKIYKGEVLLAQKLVLSENMVGDETRLYAIPFDSSTTGGYNVSLGEKVDICVLYTDNAKTIAEYQNLPDNKAIDIVLAGKQIADIRDESGNSRKAQDGAAVVPGYICFNLSYEEINKIEIAKRQGTLFIGNAENYYKEGSQAETFMTNVAMPNF